MSNASLAGLVTTGAGLAFVYGGITGKSPVQMLHAAVIGTNPKTVPATNPINYGDLPSAANAYTPGPGGGDAGQQPSGAAQTIAKGMMSSYGWNDPGDWNALVELWNKESGWNNLAWNPSGAFGIAQALGHGVAGQGANVNVPMAGRVINVNEYPTHAANAGDPTAQIQWGLDYIKSRYGSPQMAWAHETANNWY